MPWKVFAKCAFALFQHAVQCTFCKFWEPTLPHAKTLQCQILIGVFRSILQKGGPKRQNFRAYSFILQKFRAKLTGIKANKLNHAGRITYINSVLASIRIYYMQNILFSRTFTEKKKINSILRCFWWQGIQDEDSSKPFHFRSWDDMCQPKSTGGLGIRNCILWTKA